MASYKVTRRSALKCTLKASRYDNREVSPDRLLDIETIDQNVNLANVKLEVCDDFDMATQNELSSPCADSIEPKYSYGLLDNSFTEHSHYRGRGTMAKSRGRGGRRGRPPGSKSRNGVPYAGRTMKLDQIWRLNDKTLVTYFSEPSSNELTRNFAFTCALIPQECAETFTSFGGELKARNAIKEHLLNHLRQLVTRSRVEPGFEFWATKVQARKMPSAPRGRKRKLSDRSQEKSTLLERVDFVERFDSSEASNDNSFSGAHSIKHEAPEESPSFESSSSASHIRASYAGFDICQSNEMSDMESEELRMPFKDHSYSVSCDNKKGQVSIPYDSMVGPMPDTRTCGRKYALADTDYGGFISTIEDEQLMSIVVRMSMAHKVVASHLIIPMIRVPRSSIRSEEVSIAPQSIVKAPVVGNAAVSTVLPNVIDEWESTGNAQNSSGTIKRLLHRRQRFRHNFSHKSEYERKLAIQYMRELKSRTREARDQLPFECKICKTKTFTAIATLMYHYRSHAGIKPFVCMICNTTFTRQHSLNYHMLIHNNQNRFTCKDCGRRFRHPSHFKEHLRRHTGETPFKCGDCLLQFKTRNTYKRHLRTRHGKLLTASGTIRLKPEDFDRVARTPYQDISPGLEFESDTLDQNGSGEAAECYDDQLAFLEDNKDNISIIDLPSTFINEFTSSTLDQVT